MALTLLSAPYRDHHLAVEIGLSGAKLIADGRELDRRLLGFGTLRGSLTTQDGEEHAVRAEVNREAVVKCALYVDGLAIAHVAPKPRRAAVLGVIFVLFGTLWSGVAIFDGDISGAWVGGYFAVWGGWLLWSFRRYLKTFGPSRSGAERTTRAEES